MIPELPLVISLVLLLSITAQQTLDKGFQTYRKESADKEAKVRMMYPLYPLYPSYPLYPLCP